MKNLYNYSKILEKREESISKYSSEISHQIYLIENLDYWLQKHNLRSLPVDPRLEALSTRVDNLLHKIRSKREVIENFCKEQYEKYKKDCVILVTVECNFDIISGQYRGCGCRKLYQKAYRYHGHKKNFEAAKIELTKLLDTNTILKEALNYAKSYEKNHPEVIFNTCDDHFWARERTIDTIYTLSWMLDPNTEDVTSKITIK